MKKKMMPHIKAGRITQLYGFGLLVILMVTLFLNVIPNWKLQSRSVFSGTPSYFPCFSASSVSYIFLTIRPVVSALFSQFCHIFGTRGEV